MPTYADEMAARQPSTGTSRGPVRLWISSGEVVRGADGRHYVEEKWEEEEIMDTDGMESFDQDAGAGDGMHGSSKTLSQVLAHTIHSSSPTIDGRPTSNHVRTVPRGGSLLVLDTNTLLSALPFCMAMFTQCLARNAHALTTGTFVLSPVMLIVPHAVIRELDGLKSSSRRLDGGAGMTVGQAAQRANRWVLEATIQQKKRTFALPHDSNSTSVLLSLPENAWVVHVENSTHKRSAQDDPLFNDTTNDDEIISLCRILQRDTGQNVWLCSDDLNAQLRAESDAISTFSVSAWIREQIGRLEGDRDDRLREAVTQMIEQWNSQVYGYDMAMEDSHSWQGQPSSPIAMMDQDQTSVLRHPQSTLESVYAVKNGSSTHHTKHDGHLISARRGEVHSHDKPQHRTPKIPIYPSHDRSSATSMWARK